MVSGFVNQSGGEIRIESKVGEGTRIELLLPATESAAIIAKPESVKGHDLAWAKDRTIVLIDDDAAVRIVLSEQLRDAGARVREYPSGDSAIAALKNCPTDIDLVLSDFAMAGSDGIETLRQIADLVPGARRVLMTGNFDDPRLNGAGEIPVLRKPLRLDQLAPLLNDAPAV
jgi:CheY-like chemotaxis protein